jgi:hypothetical protein
MIQSDYTVSNPHMTTAATRAIVDGVEMAATIDVFEVQLVAHDLSDGSITLRFKGPDIPGAQALFTQDDEIIVQFLKLSEVKEETPATPATP